MAKNLTLSVAAFKAIKSGNYALGQYLCDLNNPPYIRGTPEGYEKMKSFVGNSTVDSPDFKKTFIWRPGREIGARYSMLYQTSLEQRGLAPEQIEYMLGNRWIEQWQEAWAEGVTQVLDEVMAASSAQYSGYEALVDVNQLLTDIMNAPASQLNSLCDQLDAKITQFESLFLTQPDNVKTSFVGLVNPIQLPNYTIINVQEGQKLFTELESLAQSLKSQIGSAQDNKAKIKILNSVRSTLSQNIGKLNEVLNSFVYELAGKEIEKAVQQASIGTSNVTITNTVHTGESRTIGSNKTAKPDNTFFATAGLTSDKSIDISLQATISEKITSQLVVKNGKWVVRNPKRDRGITLETISQLSKVIEDAFLKGTTNHRLEHIIYNNLVWETGATRAGIAIRQAVVAQLFEKYLTGDAQQLGSGSGGAINLTDVLLVNGVGIPIYQILEKAAQSYARKDYFRKVSVKIDNIGNLKKEWVGSREFLNYYDARTRSNRVLGILKEAQVEIILRAVSLAELM